VADLGSGGGFPVLPLACISKAQGGPRYVAVESNHKKTSFLRNASSQLGLSTHFSVQSDRIEAVVESMSAPEFVTARALTALPNILQLTSEWVSTNPDIRFILHKGREYQAELDACAAHWSFDLVEHESIVDPESRILELTHVKHIG
jgi:16S rRNA (guanine527-N7)-methyltransferase